MVRSDCVFERSESVGWWVRERKGAGGMKG